MVILITAFWVYQGFFSAVLMFLETVVASVIAFGFYEDLNAVWVESLGPGVGLPLALMLLFLGVLALLRVASDKFIPDNVSFPLIVDRAGGGVCGFFTGMILTGMALIGIQMLPLGPSVFFFDRFTVDKEGYAEAHDFLFKPDRFTAGFVGMLSKGRLGGDNPLPYAKPDLVLDLYCARAVPQSEARVFLPAGALTVTNYWTTRKIDRVRQSLVNGEFVRRFETDEPRKLTHKFLVCAVGIDKQAAKKNQGQIRFRLPQFRVVGPPPGPDGRFLQEPRVYPAVGMSDIYVHQGLGLAKVGERQRSRLVSFGPTTDFILGPEVTKVLEEGGKYKFDCAFEVPEDFTPWYVEFKRGAVADLSRLKEEPEPPDWASRALGDTGAAVSRGGSGSRVGAPPAGRTHLANAIEERTDATNLLPVVLPLNDPMVARHCSGNRLGRGHFYIRLPEEPVQRGLEVREFSVPASKRMVQVGAEVLKAESLYGRALNFANTTLSQIYIKGDNDHRYFAIGQYAAAEVGGEPIFEIQYHPTAEMPERCLKKPLKVTKRVLTEAGRADSKFGYLFLVDPGVKIVSFHVGRAKSQTLAIRVPN